jgi:hypothetical protein
MLGWGEHHKILGRVIVLIMITVVDNLMRKKGATQRVLRDETVLEHIPGVPCGGMIRTVDGEIACRLYPTEPIRRVAERHMPNSNRADRARFTQQAPSWSTICGKRYRL